MQTPDAAMEPEWERRVREAESEIERVRDGVAVMLLAYRRLVDGKIIELEAEVMALKRELRERDKKIERLTVVLHRYRRDGVTVTDLAAVKT